MKMSRKRIGNEQKLWHATLRRCKLGDQGQGLELCADAKCSLCQIIRTGFKKRFSLNSGMCVGSLRMEQNADPPHPGSARGYTRRRRRPSRLSFAERCWYNCNRTEMTVFRAAGYSQNSRASKYKAILLNNVVMGRAYETNEAMVGSTAPPKGFDSVSHLPAYPHAGVLRNVCTDLPYACAGLRLARQCAQVRRDVCVRRRCDPADVPHLI